MITAWVVLAVSTVLNTMYFMRTVLTLYRPVSAEVHKEYTVEKSKIEKAAIVGLILIKYRTWCGFPACDQSHRSRSCNVWLIRRKKWILIIIF